jgi:hypothetical protein
MTTPPARPALRRLIGWWIQPIPLARVAIVRAAIYLFLLYDVFFLSNDVIPHGYAPELYQPVLLARILPVPTPSPELGEALRVVIIVGALIAASGRLPRIAGWTVAVAYLTWLLHSIGFGYVYHDHLALVVAVWVLPTIGRARFTDTERSEAAGWAFRCIQIAVIATYFISACMKWIRNGSPITWANSAVFTWAIMRRGSDLVRWTIDTPAILQVAQWGIIVAEFLSPIVLFLRDKALALSIMFFLGFHLMTYLALGIHFLPTVICWLAFMPLERLVPYARRQVARLHGARVRRERGQPADAEAVA